MYIYVYQVYLESIVYVVIYITMSNVVLDHCSFRDQVNYSNLSSRCYTWATLQPCVPSMSQANDRALLELQHLKTW